MEKEIEVETPGDGSAPPDAPAATPGVETGAPEKVAEHEPPVVVSVPPEAAAPLAPPSPSPGPGRERGRVHVAPNLLELVSGAVRTPAEKRAAKEKRDIDAVVHSLLLVGLGISTALMVTGVALDLVLNRQLPTVEPDLGTAISALLALRPSGFMAVGLVVLLATPILRVVGSIFAFAYERDWGYVGITLLVLVVVMTSVVLGRG